ncbi:MAG: PspC domain-containing protein [Bacteroidia bacterium]
MSSLKKAKPAVITGVCGGLAKNMQVDPIWVRVGVVITGLFLSILVVPVYIILAIVLPSEGQAPQSYNQSAAQPGQQPQGASIFCRHCGKQNDTKGKFCRSCGGEL